MSAVPDVVGRTPFTAQLEEQYEQDASRRSEISESKYAAREREAFTPPAIPSGGPHGHYYDAQGGFKDTFSSQGPYVPPPPPPHHFQQFDPGMPMPQQFAAGTHNEAQGHLYHPGPHDGFNFGGPPAPDQGHHNWQGSFLPPPQMQPFPFGMPPHPGMPPPPGFEAPPPPPPAMWQAAAATVPQGLPVPPMVNAPYPPPPPQAPPPPPPAMGNMPPFANNVPEPAYFPPQAPQDFASAPLWLSPDVYPAIATVTFKPKGRNEPVSGLLSSTADGVELDASDAWLRRFRGDDAALRQAVLKSYLGSKGQLSSLF